MYIRRNAVKVIPKIWIYLYILCMYICWNAVKVIPKIWMYLYIIIMYVYMPDCSQSNSQNLDVFVYIMYLCMPDCSQSNSQNLDVFVYIMYAYMQECKAGVFHSHCGQIERPPPASLSGADVSAKLYRHRLGPWTTFQALSGRDFATHNLYKWSAMRAVLTFH